MSDVKDNFKKFKNDYFKFKKSTEQMVEKSLALIAEVESNSKSTGFPFEYDGSLYIPSELKEMLVSNYGFSEDELRDALTFLDIDDYHNVSGWVSDY